MSARLAAVALLAAAVIPLAGCAVGRFVVGAPAPGSARPAQAILLRRCSSCHATPDPAAMTAAEWQAGLALMKQRLHLPQAEWDSLAVLQGTTGSK